MATTLPDYLHIGAIVQIAEWYGEVVDLAITEAGKIMVLVTSPKAVFRNHRDEWLEFNPELIKPATSADYVRDIEFYARRTRANLEKLENMAAEWRVQLKRSEAHL